jgi:glucosamine kinase
LLGAFLCFGYFWIITHLFCLLDALLELCKNDQCSALWSWQSGLLLCWIEWLTEHMTKQLIVGIDGGASHTRVVIADLAGQIMARGEGGPCNIFQSTPLAWHSIEQAIDQALAQLALTRQQCQLHVGLGIAGLESAVHRREFLAYPHGFADLVVESDAYTACLGAHAGADGAIVSIGTGVIGWQLINQQASRVGGWGFPIDDQGGGAWLGLRALQLTLQWRDGRVPASSLLTAIYRRFSSVEGILEWLATAKSADFGSLAPLVIEHLQQGDTVALALIQQAALAIEAVIQALTHQVQGQPLPLALVGGLAPVIQPYLTSQLQRSLVSAKGDGLSGALYLIRHQLARDYRPQGVYANVH